jgi:hypothetical protein
LAAPGARVLEFFVAVFAAGFFVFALTAGLRLALGFFAAALRRVFLLAIFLAAIFFFERETRAGFLFLAFAFALDFVPDFVLLAMGGHA